jgi:hypothetical protein
MIVEVLLVFITLINISPPIPLRELAFYGLKKSLIAEMF